MDYIRIAADTQISTVACFIKSIILDHSSATSLILYNEATSAKTAGADFLTVRNTTSELTKVITFPGRGLRFNTGCHCKYNAGTIYYALG
jgi:hypothetical protein